MKLGNWLAYLGYQCTILHYSAFYERIGRTPPTDEELLVVLREAVARSREKHYHGDKGIEVLSPEGIYCYNLIHQAQIGVFWEQLKPDYYFIH